MKKVKNKPYVWLVLCVTLLSFSSELGGHSYSISLNEKVLVQQYLTRDASIPSIILDQNDAKEQLSVNFNECGQVGKGRIIGVKDESKKFLKEWRFADGSGANMKINVSDILALYNKDRRALELVYTSHEVSRGKTLASITSTKNSAIVQRK